MISFYDKVTSLVDEGEMVNVIFLAFIKAFDNHPLQHPSGQIVQLRDKQMHAMLGDELAQWSISKDFSEWGYICLADGQ